MHVYLSPHLDDAVLSCGGAIHRQVGAGERVIVVSIFTQEFPGQDLPPFALVQHRYWGHPPRPMALRRAEDAAALAWLGAEPLHLEYPDAVYRADPQDKCLYPDVEALFGELHPDDPLSQDGAQRLVDRLADLSAAVDQPEIVAPLGVGHHVDHMVVHRAARRLLQDGFRVTFYEDYPYAENPEALRAALTLAGGVDWRPQTIGLDAADLAAKVASLGYYRSQLGVLFGGAEAMPNRIWSFAAARSENGGLGERLWCPSQT